MPASVWANPSRRACSRPEPRTGRETKHKPKMEEIIRQEE